MKLPSTTITCLCLFRSISAAVVARAATNPMDPFLGVPPQITQGQSPTFTFLFPNHTISQYTLTLQSPNGTVSHPFSASLFTNVTSPVPNQPPVAPTEPTTRFCIDEDAVPSPGSYSEPIKQAGNWTVSLQMTYHYGANGYEYDAGGKVCISPPFTSETFNTSRITMVVLPSTNGSPSPIPTPSPSDIGLQGSITGTPFVISTVSTSMSSATNVATNSAGPALTWKKGTGITMAFFILFMTTISA